MKLENRVREKEYELECADRGGRPFRKQVTATSHTQAVLKAHDDPKVFVVKATKYENIR